MDAGIGGRTRRVFAVLAVAVGVLAMHGLAGGHHGAVPVLTPLSPVGSAAHEHSAPAGGAGHELLAGPLTATAPLHGLVGACAGDCDDHPSGLLLLCVAVLLAAGLALILGLARRTWRTVPATGPPPAPQPRTKASLRRLDLVADLCVSRT